MKASVSIISACLLFMALLCNPESLHEQCQDKFLFSLEFKCWLCCHLSLLPGHADARCNERSLTMTNKQTDRRGSELSPCAALLIKIFACNLCQHCVRGADDVSFSSQTCAWRVNYADRPNGQLVRAQIEYARSPHGPECKGTRE